MPPGIQAIAQQLQSARRVAVLTGAGVSAESGIATFRDPLTGLWKRFDPATMATAEAFEADPPLIWGWYEWRRMKVMQAQPNPAHLALARMARHVPQFTLVTQNVDDLHERAGSPEVIHLHGRITQPVCFDCRQPHEPPPGIPDVPEDGLRIDPPRCAHCGGLIRPGVVWFGEPLPPRNWKAAAEAASRCEVFLCIGTSAMVRPAASLLDIAARAGAVTVDVNPNPSDAGERADHALRGPAGNILPRIASAAWGSREGLPL
jgi:NAD-dependent deacetylase